MHLVVRFDIRTEPIHEINAISRFAVGFEVQEYRRFADIASWVLHDGDRANLLKQQGEGLSVVRLQATKTYRAYALCTTGKLMFLKHLCTLARGE